MLQTHQSGGTHLSYNTLLHFFLCTELPFLFGAFSRINAAPTMFHSGLLSWKRKQGGAQFDKVKYYLTGKQASSHTLSLPWCLQSSARRYCIALLTCKLSLPVSYSFQVTTGGSAVKPILKRLWHDHINSFYCGEGRGLLQKIADLNRA